MAAAWANIDIVSLHPGDHGHPLLVILALLACLNSTTNPWIYLCFSSALFQGVKVIEREN